MPYRHERGAAALALVLVLAVLGVLFVIVIVGTRSSPGPKVTHESSNDAAIAACRADVAAVRLSAETVKIHEGAYPTSENVRDLSDPSKGGLLKSFPANTAYALRYTSDGTAFTVTSDKSGCP